MKIGTWNMEGDKGKHNPADQADFRLAQNCAVLLLTEVPDDVPLGGDYAITKNHVAPAMRQNCLSTLTLGPAGEVWLVNDSPRVRTPREAIADEPPAPR